METLPPKARRPEMAEGMAAVLDIRDLMTNPTREQELRTVGSEIMDRILHDFVEGRLSASVEDILVEALLETKAKENDVVGRMLEAFRKDKGRDAIKELLRATTREQFKT